MDFNYKKTIDYIKKKHKFTLSKALGQNFLVDESVIDDIVNSTLIDKETLVIEIGPGIGVLTWKLAEVAGKLVAIELDERLIPILNEQLFMYPNVEIINKDILKVDINEIIENTLIDGKKPKSVRIVGNLPYYITTPIIMKLIEGGVKADSITIMMQKEVADRLVSPPGKKDYGAITLAVQYSCRVNHITFVPASAFVPPPKVNSTVLRLDVRKEKAVKLEDEDIFFALIKAGFGKRRKTMSNSLLGVCGLDKLRLQKVFDDLGIDSGRRAETMSMEEFAELANYIYAKKETFC